LQGVYFPLQRFGKFFVAAEKDGTNTFLMFESLNELDRAVKDLQRRDWAITARGQKMEGRATDAPSGTFVADVIDQLRTAHVSDAVQDQVYQLYLQTMPELSMRKHQIHRKSVPGFDPDAVRAFAYNMQHGSHQLARLRYAHKLQG
ncbi:PLxRFG domain-containing protein, partial [Pseudomonas aeruginosa]|uniref:PLxRFG domain-containing protein n=1 Tax=Pseudomonas aeruginosa TaxID=287 RepID=UPI0020963A66